MRSYLSRSVFEEAVERVLPLYRDGHRVVVSFSGGKDSGCALECCRIAARMTNRLPVEVVMRDEEIMLPGTFEYAERIAAQDDIDFHWVVANQPVINIFNRAAPYFWVFDPLLDPSCWVRQPPPFTEYIKEQNILALINREKFPPAEGKELVEVVGLRVQESAVRRAGIASSGGHLTKIGKNGARKCRPIYDWTDGDVWKAIGDQQWDYNSAYDTMFRMGMKTAALRIGPPTMTWYALPALQVAAKAWPRWFNRVCNRLPGIRTVVQFGKRAVIPTRKLGEDWRDTYNRACVDEAPAEWIRDRATFVRDHYLSRHAQHATTPFPEIRPCSVCSRSNASWRNLCFAMFNGNPFSLKMQAFMKEIEPEFFRPGAGKWGGKPTW